MASRAEEFKEFEAAGWSRRASTYGRVTGTITARSLGLLVDVRLEEVAVETVAVRHRVKGDAMVLWDGLLAGGHELSAVAKVGCGRR